MATTTVSQSVNRGGAFLVTPITPAEIFTPADVTDQVVLALGDANSSALITMRERNDYKYVVMPMRI